MHVINCKLWQRLRMTIDDLLQVNRTNHEADQIKPRNKDFSVIVKSSSGSAKSSHDLRLDFNDLTWWVIFSHTWLSFYQSQLLNLAWRSSGIDPFSEWKPKIHFLFVAFYYSTKVNKSVREYYGNCLWKYERATIK